MQQNMWTRVVFAAVCAMFVGGMHGVRGTDRRDCRTFAVDCCLGGSLAGSLR